MERESALRLLNSAAVDDRVRGARFFAKYATETDASVLQSLLNRESNRWVKVALRKGIQLTGIGPHYIPAVENGASEDDKVIEQIHSEAVEETTLRLVHELRPIVGRLDLAASQEIANYESSRTKAEWQHLQKMLSAIDKLSKAASSPMLKEFDLSTAIDEIVQAESLNKKIVIQCAGPRPCLAMSSSELVELVLSNAVRNAIEASETVESTKVVITWDATDLDYWVSVLDRGCGLPPGADRVYDFGTTTKRGHLGVGLALARQAAVSLAGNIMLTAREGGGVNFEFRWPKVSHETSTR